MQLLWYTSSAVYCEWCEPPVRRGPGSAGAHLHWLLADGVGAEDADFAHADQWSGSYWYNSYCETETRMIAVSPLWSISKYTSSHMYHHSMDTWSWKSTKQAVQIIQLEKHEQIEETLQSELQATPPA